MTNFIYFAYGSNLLTQRLTARCPSARSIGIARAPGFESGFFLRSSDGSGKVGILPKLGGEVWGVLYEIHLNEQHILDRFEGTPQVYTRQDIKIDSNVSHNLKSAETYFPCEEYLTTSDTPYDWYRALCLGGARQHKLQQSAINVFSGASFQTAPYQLEQAKEGHSQALLALKAAGYADAAGRLLV